MVFSYPSIAWFSVQERMLIMRTPVNDFPDVQQGQVSQGVANQGVTHQGQEPQQGSRSSSAMKTVSLSGRFKSSGFKWSKSPTAELTPANSTDWSSRLKSFVPAKTDNPASKAPQCFQLTGYFIRCFTLMWTHFSHMNFYGGHYRNGLSLPCHVERC
jgi:hypothetical protein